MICLELYPYGTLGRIFIDTALQNIKKMYFERKDDTLCITEPEGFSEELEGIIKDFIKDQKMLRKGFHLTGNDKASLIKDLRGFIDKDDPSSILRYAINSLKKGGYDNLKRTITAPAIIRIEFYEYSRPGYITKISQKYKEHPYKKMNILSLALSIAGAYIGFVTRGKDNIAAYFIPEYRIEKQILDEIKEEIKITLEITQHHPTPVIFSYAIAKYLVKLLEEKQIFLDTLGNLILINVKGNKPTLIRIEPLTGEGIEKILLYLSRQSRQLLDEIIRILIRYFDLKAKNRELGYLKNVANPLYTIILDLYRIARQSSEAVYDCIRNALLIRDNIVEDIKKHKKEHGIVYPWYKLYTELKETIENPIRAINEFIHEISRIAEELEVFY